MSDCLISERQQINQPNHRRQSLKYSWVSSAKINLNKVLQEK